MRRGKSPGTTLADKLKLGAGDRAAIVNPPEGYLEELRPPEGPSIKTDLNGKFTWVQVFVKTRAELEALLPQIRSALEPASLLWISFPKRSSKIQTDLTRDQGWDSLRESDLRWVNLISVNETWSAFSLRPYRSGETRQTFR
jgi:hypothetical protein